ncbi:similar to Saccharomyces cerevisiae YOL052C SPE2 S-adenosylmethionine decarboxylase, required for the biosynthesis of spermidine and spermine [Maudiozyma barnettii]|uniref:adenosylmethionine decarboxylase n=1 Tax=Maudiozyma barnettii TaxID=61262 RepID=A0A8H2VCC3_9SACH|nr:adenosylmethionine decarboxylase SPE2 [Kazachstania barnettii]CAB4252651.1 similar to Saccharomyces cerevisiae YOL052C SPE2 S-adenosylmethionine decarboxylase, required for the biosynthesis of spermidine and spermine [Kazachstania barnettii]CAD1780123.1 similar to Saccharomyces cerevisiae YOL052C SPE2 S-adenosylmethionine decarboxylase, required for the biosynthesis of spermidine and spermine [Kazachstania barnettii]
MTITIKELTNHSYIDHELSATLDSTEAFEGPEKLLEIWFYPDPCAIPDKTKTLRSIPVQIWTDILKLVKCEVLSTKSTKCMDAFLLSESSLFVYDHKITMKTCGTTTTLFCLEEVFKQVESLLNWKCNIDNDKFSPYKVFYSRRSFMFPSKQRSIHRNWNDEVDYLNKFFTNGKSYTVGRSDQGTHWNLYVTDTNKSSLVNDDTECHETNNYEYDNDETVEILMTGLNHKCADQFVCNREVKSATSSIDEKDNDADDEGHLLGYNMTKKTGLDKIYHESKNSCFHHDAFAFSPCGYSSNMIIDEKYYYTLHVTPEKGWSYASFESNVPVNAVSDNKQDNVDVMQKILKVFQPTEFCLTFFCKDIQNSRSFQRLISDIDIGPKYTKIDKIIYDLDDYQLLYLRFEMKNSENI